MQSKTPQHTTMVDPSDLTEEQLEQLMNNPQVQKTLQYDEAGLDEIADRVGDFIESADEDVYDLLTQGVADRSGRVSQQTVQKVLDGLVAEVNEVIQDSE